MIWLVNTHDKTIYGYFESNDAFNIIEWRPEGWRLTRNKARPVVSHWWEEITKEQLIKKKAFRNTIHVILANPEEVKKKWR